VNGIGWRAAMESSLYGPDGFFVGAADGPAGHFRTSVHASPLFAGALLRLLERVDAALGHPDPFDLVDVGAGRGELLAAVRSQLAGSADPRTAGFADPRLAARIRYTAVELAPRPAGLDGDIVWRRDVPDTIVGQLVATEWLDNVPLDVAELDKDGRPRRVLVDPETGAETLGGSLDPADISWLARWSPFTGTVPGERAEIGWPRDQAWADAVSRVRRGCALAVDYGHLRQARPVFGTLTGFLGGRQVPPVPDGSRDLTAHVAMDAVAAAGGNPYLLIDQRTALTAVGVNGARPPLDLARTDPVGYVRALSAAGAAAELLDPAGLGGHWWLLHGIGIDPRGIICV
jgi:SAM-dependent MidA family methyltransferase